MKNNKVENARKALKMAVATVIADGNLSSDDVLIIADRNFEELELQRNARKALKKAIATVAADTNLSFDDVFTITDENLAELELQK